MLSQKTMCGQVDSAVIKELEAMVCGINEDLLDNAAQIIFTVQQEPTLNRFNIFGSSLKSMIDIIVEDCFLQNNEPLSCLNLIL